MNVSSPLHAAPHPARYGLDEQRFEQCLDKMVDGHLSGGERRVVRKAFQAIGQENVDKLLQGGVKLKVPDPFATDSPSHQAAYYPGKKVLVLASSRFDKDTLVHELGHALDDIAEPDVQGKAVLRSEVDGEVERLHHSYCERVQGLSWWDKLWNRGQWSEYATTNPQEYLAEGVRKFAGSSRAHDHLLRDDPKLCEYLQRFLHPEPQSTFALTA